MGGKETRLRPATTPLSLLPGQGHPGGHQLCPPRPLLPGPPSPVPRERQPLPFRRLLPGKPGGNRRRARKSLKFRCPWPRYHILRRLEKGPQVMPFPTHEPYRPATPVWTPSLFPQKGQRRGLRQTRQGHLRLTCLLQGHSTSGDPLQDCRTGNRLSSLPHRQVL